MLMKNELEEINHLIEGEDRSSSKVSQKGVYWHTDHILNPKISIGFELIPMEVRRIKEKPIHPDSFFHCD